ncbi:rhamnogalacturonan acetylesterase [Lysobacter sp. CFH 32150]|uniref:rhamnogalacturonan acetylesterase n=1 Tax=Lysobacter sp. CFH 32150 TaxID=2927128 RepID=UPI001FA817D0|nr:rhamnogalacturonan acetylesterase [Lysobacter sp. CFH 32150]MCI4567947.1 rhamnogalacturonan acetylesterase [Lysobacter sp. CFH 32150]
MHKLITIACLFLSLAARAESPVSPPADVAEQPVTLFLAGDSTIAEKLASKRPETGWGEYLGVQFLPGKVVVDNRARNGRSTRTFIEEGRWQALIDYIRPGDYVFIQFGHNDGSVQKKDRYTPPADYRRNLERFVADVHARKATPILLTPVARRKFDDGQLLPSHGEYPQIVRAIAREQNVALIDLLARSETILRTAGDDGSKPMFLWLAPGEHPNYPAGLEDNTHFSPIGAQRMAEAVADGLRQLDLPLSAALQPEAGGMPPK